MLGGLAAGIIATLLPTMLEMTYRPVNDAIGGDFPLGILLLSFLVKPVSNAVTLSSGGSGGTFAPSIKAGAMWGAALTLVIGALVPSIPPGLLAVACAAGVLAGTWKIPLTAAVLLPLLLTCVLASFVVSRIPSAGSFNPIETKD
jgi:CIC family chloride channel protein